MAILMAVFGPAGPASAHATLISTDPAEGSVAASSPGAITFAFNEPVSLPPQGVSVFDATGQPVTSSASSRDAELRVTLPDELAAGSYVVAWRIVSADGHPVAGSLTFSVGKPSMKVVAPDAVESTDRAVVNALSIAQAVTYAGLLLCVGLGIFMGFVLPAAAPADRARRRVRTLVLLAAIGSGLAGLLTLPLTVVNQQGLRLSGVMTVAAWTGTAPADVVSLVMLVGGLAAVAGCVFARTRGRRGQIVLGLGVACAVVAPALTGHSRAFEPTGPVIAMDVLHVFAGAVWFGGLVGLALTLPSIAHRRSQAVQALARFSTLAASVLGLLVTAGVLLGWRILGSWEALFQTGYGWLLLAKVATVAVAAVVAAYNRLKLLPRYRVDGGHAEHQSAARGLARVVSAEAAVLVLVVGLTGFLVHQSPALAAQVVPEGRTGLVSAPLGENHKVLATLGPGGVGPNTVRVQLQDLTGEPFEPSSPPAVRVLSDALDLGRVNVSSEAAGTFRGEIVLPSTGPWEMQVSVRLSEFENPVAVVAFPAG